MVNFNELRINDDKSSLIIDCSVEDLTIYENMYIKSAELYYYKNTNSSGEPVNLSKVITVFDNEDDDTTIKHIRKCVPVTALTESSIGTSTYDKGIFFVRITCDGTLPASVSQFACGMDETVDIGVVVDWATMFRYGMGFVASVDVCGDMCQSKAGYEQFILTWFSIKLALAACDFAQLGILWDRFLKLTNYSTVNNTSTCGCHA